MSQNGAISNNFTKTFSFLKMAKRHLVFYVFCTACLTLSTLFILEYSGNYSTVSKIYELTASEVKVNSEKSDHQTELQDQSDPVKTNLLQSMKTKSGGKSLQKKSAKKKKGKEKKKKKVQDNAQENFSDNLFKTKFLSQTREIIQLSKEDKAKAAILSKLSKQFQTELHEIQNPNSCNEGKFLHCGYDRSCGLGCSFHHHMGCLIFSYAMKIPLIHNETKGWSYKDPWSKYFYSIGSECKVNDNSNSTSGNNVTLLKWDWPKFEAQINNQSVDTKSTNQVFSEGIPVPRKFGQELMKNHKSPFLWMIGQFIKATFNVKEKFLQRIEEYEKSLGILNEDGKQAYPLIGMHVRRTDKYRETPFVFTPKDFMKAATDYRAKWTGQQLSTFPQNWSSVNETGKSELESVGRNPWKIFIASEDYRVISEFRQKAANTLWEFVGDEKSHAVHKTRTDRTGHLYEIVRDIIVLSHCDYVICTVSSNVCRLLVDIAGLTRLNPTRHFKLLEGGYRYKLGRKVLPQKLKLLNN